MGRRGTASRRIAALWRVALAACVFALWVVSCSSRGASRSVYGVREDGCADVAPYVSVVVFLAMPVLLFVLVGTWAHRRLGPRGGWLRTVLVVLPFLVVWGLVGAGWMAWATEYWPDQYPCGGPAPGDAWKAALHPPLLYVSGLSFVAMCLLSNLYGSARWDRRAELPPVEVPIL